MQIDFPSEIEEVNDTDFDILRCLHQNGALWKMEVTRRVNQRRGKKTLLNLKDSITKQAVAKRMERLHELDYIESSIISAERDGETRFIRGYSTTLKGEKILLRGIKLVLRDTVSELLMSSKKPQNISCLDSYLSIYSELSGYEVENLGRFVSLHLQQE
jgi:hypothetical protein